MSLTIEEVIKIAYLARLGISTNNIKLYTHDLANVLELMVKMKEINTDSVEPMHHPINQIQRLREDIALESNQRENFQAIAPQVESGLYLVPQVIKAKET